jgi:hypothetical protein
MKHIRKVSVGANYKDAMHYVVDQNIMGGDWSIHAITKDEDGYSVWIQQEDEIKKWKHFNLNMPITVEFNVQY